MALINKRWENKLLLDKFSLFGRQKSLKMWVHGTEGGRDYVTINNTGSGARHLDSNPGSTH